MFDQVLCNTLPSHMHHTYPPLGTQLMLCTYFTRAHCIWSPDRRLGTVPQTAVASRGRVCKARRGTGTAGNNSAPTRCAVTMWARNKHCGSHDTWPLYHDCHMYKHQPLQPVQKNEHGWQCMTLIRTFHKTLNSA